MRRIMSDRAMVENLEGLARTRHLSLRVEQVPRKINKYNRNPIKIAGLSSSK